MVVHIITIQRQDITHLDTTVFKVIMVFMAITAATVTTVTAAITARLGRLVLPETLPSNGWQLVGV